MKVDFNVLRIKLGRKYNTLCRIVKILNQSVSMEEARHYEDLNETVNDLHDLIATLICLESDGEGEKFEAIDMELFVLEDEDK